MLPIIVHEIFLFSIFLRLLNISCFTAHAQDHHFVIYDLHFDCVYVVRLQDDTDRVSGHVLVTTPPCDHVTVVGNIKPYCPPKGRRSTDLSTSLVKYAVIRSSVFEY